MHSKRSAAFADQVRGIDERIQAKIEELDEVWLDYWSGVKKILIGSTVVFGISLICAVTGVLKEVVTVSLPLSFFLLFGSYVASSYAYAGIRI